MRHWIARVLPEPWVPYLLHTRPRAWFIVTAHMSVGFLLANGFDFSAGQLGRWALAALAWGVLGNGGTLAINSAFDRDEGDIGYLEDPPPVPRHLAPFALALLALGLLPAARLGARFLVAYVICFTLSVLYSVPPFRLKARAGLDVLLNASGYGGLTMYAGWAAAARPLNPPIVNVVVAFFFFFVGFYPLTQIYQMAEDTRRGDYTLALALGKQRALLLALIGVGLGFVFLGLEAVRRYWVGRALGLLLALIGWALVLIPWYVRRHQVSERYEQRGFYLALYAWAVTDIAVAVAMMPLG
jgi:4-hydroxybenzoate polyprenyltransferase